MSRYFYNSIETKNSKDIHKITKCSTYCNWHTYEGVEDLNKDFIGFIDKNNIVYDNCQYLSILSTKKFNLEMENWLKSYNKYKKNITYSINILKNFKKKDNVELVLKKILPLMYIYTQQNIDNYYLLYKEYYETFYLFKEYNIYIEKIRKKYDSLYQTIITELREQDDYIVKDKRKLKNKAHYYLDKNGNKVFIENKKEQVIVSNID